MTVIHSVIYNYIRLFVETCSFPELLQVRTTLPKVSKGPSKTARTGVCQAEAEVLANAQPIVS